MFKLQIVPSLNHSESAEQFFTSLKGAVARALEVDSIASSEAWTLCEYLDAVDANDVAMDRPVYRQCVTALASYLLPRMNTPEVLALAQKSWAAHTLVEVLGKNVETLPSARCAA